MSSITLTLSIRFKSDWHIGTGGGRFGNVDALVARDPQTKLPYVPGKTLKGIWRDAAEQLAAALDKALDKVPNATAARETWQDYVDLAFGKASSKLSATSTAALLHIDAAHFSKSDIKFLQGAAGGALTALRPGIKIDAASGTAEVNCLRIEERVASGCTLSSHVALGAEGYDAQIQAALLALLTGAALWVQHLGGNRRRGAGRCVWQLTGDAVLALLKSRPPKITHAAPNAGTAETPAPAPAATPYTGSAQFVRLTLQSKTPVVVPLMVAGNVVVGRDELPGTDLLSALMPYLAADPGVDLRQLIAQGCVRISPGYPAGCQRTPLCLDQLKDGEGPICNLLVRAPADAAPAERSGAPTIIAPRKMLRGDFIALDVDGTNGTYQRHRVSKSVRNHSTIDDSKQRPTEDVGGLYSYEAISVGQQFSVDIALPAGVRLITPASVRLGISKNTDYGKLDVLAVVNLDPPSAGSDPNYLTLVLLSPLLCLGANLKTDASVNGLRCELNRSHPVLAASLVWSSAKAFIATARFDGWLTKLAMPRPSLIALAAGSVIRVPYKIADTTGAHVPALTKIATEGLGARRAEGFGWISVNPDWAKHSKFDKQPELSMGKSATPENAALTQPTDAFQLAVWQRYWQAKITADAMGKGEAFATRLALTGLPTSQSSNLLQEALQMQTWTDRGKFLRKRRECWSKTTTERLAQLGDPVDQTAFKALKNDFFAELPNNENIKLHALRSLLIAAVHAHRHASEQPAAIGATS